MKKLFDGFALAFSMLTIVPFFKVHHFFKGINGYSAMFYPLVGALLGATLYGIYIFLTPYLPQPHLHLLLFALLVILTGALHLDGLSDSIDGFFVAKERSLEVMKDSHVGGMGMIFTFVFLSVKLSAFLYLENVVLLIPILLLSRLNALFAIYFFNYVSSGVGALLKSELKLRYLAFASLYSVAVVLYFANLWFVVVSLFTLGVIATLLTRRLGGLNGDSYGFIIEMSELVLLHFAMVVVWLK